MNINLSGLTFRAHSPSHFELLSVNDDVGAGATVAIRFNGMAWLIDYSAPGTHIERIFKSRDAAVQLIADRRP